MTLFFVMASKKLWFYNIRFLKAQVWVVVEVITFALNHVVLTCVLNQSRGHWLLFNTLTTCVTLIVKMETKLLQLSNLFKVLNPFET